MATYFSTFPAGAESIVEKGLHKLDSGVLVASKHSGMVIYESKLPIADIEKIRFFNNSFSLLYEIKGTPTLREMLNKLRTDELFIKELRKVVPDKARTFKIVASVENQNVVMPPIQRKKLEIYIADETRLSLSPQHPNNEIWIIQRKEGFVLVGLRLTYTDPSIYKSKKGELSPQMANIMCQVSEPSPNDIVLDPFAGYGGIVFERAKAFPYKKIIAIEKDSNLVRKMKERAKSFDTNLLIEQGNAGSLKLADKSVNVIITDPPWGIYERGINGDIEVLYQKMLEEFRRVLTKEGRLIVLTGAKDIFEEILKHISNLKMIAKNDVLVSGKKAAIYKVVKL